MAAIHVCCSNDRTATLTILSLLVTYGADIEMCTRDRWRLRPLHVAARAHNGYAAARMLLAFGANPISTRADGKTPYETLIAKDTPCGRDLKKASTVWSAVTGQWVPRAALVAAVGRGKLMRASALLSKRTSPNSFDRHGLSALHVACACNDAAAVTMLLKAGAYANRVARDGSGEGAASLRGRVWCGALCPFAAGCEGGPS